ncbi:MAG: Sensor protein [uncultured bacterium]|nr:MAG: Sensor protein [uncultured bacterium]
MKKTVLIILFLVIPLLFATVSFISYFLLRNTLVQTEEAKQIKVAEIVEQNLNIYFDGLKNSLENIALSKIFIRRSTDDQAKIRHKTLPEKIVKSEFVRLRMTGYLAGPREYRKTEEYAGGALKAWQVYRGIPDVDPFTNKPLAVEEREITRNLLRSFPDLHYSFEMDNNGDLVFLEPFDIQKEASAYNYIFRDYLQMVKKTRKTSVSEGYISHDIARTQIITVATPIFDETGNINSVLALSVSAKTLARRIFRPLKETLGLTYQSYIMLIDRHGHVVANSRGKHLYFPKNSVITDSDDQGNIRHLGFFKDFTWFDDVLENGNIWERKTKSWQSDLLPKVTTSVYENLDAERVLGTFIPITFGINDASVNWGILIETPVSFFSQSTKNLTLLFIVVGLSLLGIVLALAFIVNKSISSLERDIRNTESEGEKQIRQTSRQVAHDIRSPLTALKIVSTDLKDVPEEHRLLIRSAVQRIEDIANDLSAKKDPVFISHVCQGEVISNQYHEEGQTSVQLLSAVIETLVSEKRIQYRSQRGIQIEAGLGSESYGHFAKIQLKEFKRVLSNLINNAVEAFDENGQVAIRMKSVRDVVVIVIEDNGKGIPKEIIPKLMNQGVSFGKEKGQGLGLYHAHETIKSWGGDVKVDSEVGKGTNITITLPKTKEPDWFLPELVVPASHIIILDDDDSIHQVWENRLTATERHTSSVIHFKDPQQLIGWYHNNFPHRQSPNLAMLFLCDYELIDSKKTGLDVIEELRIGSQSVLVTSHYEEDGIKAECAKLGVKMIPKNLAGYIPIKRIHVLTTSGVHERVVEMSSQGDLEAERNPVNATNPNVSNLPTSDCRGATHRQNIEKHIGTGVKKTKTILILNDEAGVLLSLKIIFKKQGHVVLCATNVSEAIKLMSEHTVDLVVSDINLGQGTPDGFEFIKRVRTKNDTVPFYFLSGYCPHEFEAKALANGATGYIQTPASQEQLLALLN